MSGAGTTAAALLADASSSGELQAGLPRWEERRPHTGLAHWEHPVYPLYSFYEIEQEFNLLITATSFPSISVSDKIQQLS